MSQKIKKPSQPTIETPVLEGVPKAKNSIIVGVGRKAHHSPRELKEELDAYFDYNKGSRELITPAGMLLALGITHSMWNIYVQKPNLAAICEEAKLKMEHLGTLRLYQRGNNADIFYLKNMGWVDKKETNIKVTELIGEHVSNEQQNKLLERAVKRLGTGRRSRPHAKKR